MIELYCENLQHSSIILPVWLNVRMFVYKLSGCGSNSCCSVWQSIEKYKKSKAKEDTRFRLSLLVCRCGTAIWCKYITYVKLMKNLYAIIKKINKRLFCTIFHIIKSLYININISKNCICKH